MKRWGIALAMLGLLWGSPVGATWQFLGFDNGNAAEYFDPTVTKKGKSSQIKSFSEKPVKDMVPVYDEKKPDKYTLLPFKSEMSTYEFDCKAKTIQLVSRTFYSDLQGRMPIITYDPASSNNVEKKNKLSSSKSIDQRNSEFARQFHKTPVNDRSAKNRLLMQVACGADSKSNPTPTPKKP